MNPTPEHREESLQHAAEHERPGKRNPVLMYLVILFAAAFFLLLMSFLMQQRANREALDDLEQTSNSAVQSLENTIQQNESLKQQVSQLEEEKTQLTSELAQAKKEADAAQLELEAQLEALNSLNHLRALYNQGRYREARDYLASIDPAQTQTCLEAYAATLTAEEREVYDPAEAWSQLVSWLE